jgi:seryl-tRNA synthetase
MLRALQCTASLTQFIVMLDPQLIRTDPEAVAAGLASRGYTLEIDQWRVLEGRRKELQVSTQELQSRKNTSARAIGEAKRKGEDIQPLLDDVREVGETLTLAEAELGLAAGYAKPCQRGRSGRQGRD